MLASPGPAMLSQTSPTGFCSLPPPGPAMPVMPTPISACRRSRAPAASASATSRETAPCSRSAPGRRRRARPSPRCCRRRGRPSRSPRTPARSVRRAASRPPVHDSAVAIVWPCRAAPARRARRSCCRRSRTACRRGALRQARRARRRRRCRVWLVARDDLDLAPFQARRDLEALELDRPRARPRASVSAISDSGMPNSRSVRCSYVVAPPSAAFSASVATACCHIG